MFKPVKMQRLMLLAMKDYESRLISSLHKAGMVEIRSLDVPGLEKGKPLEIHNDVSREVVRIRGIISAFQLLPFAKKEKNYEKIGMREPEYVRCLAEAGRIRIDAELKELVDLRSKHVAELAEREKKKEEISKAAYFAGVDFSRLETRNFTFVLGSAKKKVFAQFRKDLEEYLNRDCEILHTPTGKDDEMALVFYPRKENIEFVLSRYNFEKIHLPDNFSSFDQGAKALDAETAATKKIIAETEKKIAEMHDANMPSLVRLEKELSVLSARAAISTKFASSRKIIAIKGWIKKKDENALKDMLRLSFPEEAEIVELETGEDAPVVLDNPKSIHQFQWLVEFYSRPSYREFDPTFLLLFTVPIMYGMIVGDVGYGLISIILSSLILRKFKSGMLGNIAKIWLFSSIAAMLFGVVFDEWLGFPHLKFLEWLKKWGINTGIEHQLYEGIGRSHNLNLVIGLSLLVGIVHLSLGFILGAMNAWHHDKKHAAAKIFWLSLLLSGTASVATLMFNMLPQDVGNIAVAMLAVSVVAVIALEGVPGLFEIPGLAANALSYSRIAAAGVVGVILAEMINETMLPTPERSIVMIPVFILLHVLNAAFAMFESMVQGGRLNLVEFYSKFFHGGGQPFSPFAAEEFKNE